MAQKTAYFLCGKIRQN